MNYTEAADRYMKEILFMKDELKVRQQLEAIAHFDFQTKLRLIGYVKLASQYRESVERNRSTDIAAAQILEQLLDEIDKETAIQGSSNNNLPTELREALQSRLRTIFEKRLQTRVDKASRIDNDRKFQEASRQEAELIIQSLGPIPHDGATLNKIQHIRDSCEAKAYAALGGVWTLLCGHCKLRHTYRFSEERIETLVRDGILTLDTKQSRSSALELVMSMTEEAHTQTIPLATLIRLYLNSN
jgi:hypothetical protein